MPKKKYTVDQLAKIIHNPPTALRVSVTRVDTGEELVVQKVPPKNFSSGKVGYWEQHHLKNEFVRQDGDDAADDVDTTLVCQFSFIFSKSEQSVAELRDES